MTSSMEPPHGQARHAPRLPALCGTCPRRWDPCRNGFLRLPGATLSQLLQPCLAAGPGLCPSVPVISDGCLRTFRSNGCHFRRRARTVLRLPFQRASAPYLPSLAFRPLHGCAILKRKSHDAHPVSPGGPFASRLFLVFRWQGAGAPAEYDNANILTFPGSARDMMKKSHLFV